MKSFPVYGEDSFANSAIKKIIEGALGKAISLSEAATTANGLVPEGEFGFFGTNLYYTLNGSTYSVPLTLV